MAGIRVRASDEGALTAAVSLSLNEINAELDAELSSGIDEAGATSLTYLRGNSPKDTGAYRKAWKRHTDHADGHHTTTIHNEIGQLTHLLVDGHDSYNQYGGPYGRVGPAKPEGFVESAYDRGMAALRRRTGV